MDRKLTLIPLGLVVLVALPATILSSSHSQASSRTPSGARTFPETGKTVRGKFLQYWEGHGGLSQQGFPISSELQEKSDTDGKVYTVQYFERAVFELHPENPPPSDVLLSLLGVFSYSRNYSSGAPGQQPNNTPGSLLFKETGKRLGGKFLSYWKSHGGLPQQGFPISDEFMEKSALDGKTYRVQYFERAVFEMHPENPPPYDVLLSQLGTLRYRVRYPSGQPDASPTPTPTPGAGGACAPGVAPGIWAGSNETLTTASGSAVGLEMSMEGLSSLRLQVACDGSFTGRMTYQANGYVRVVQEFFYHATLREQSESEVTGRVVAGQGGLPLLILDTRVTAGTRQQTFEHNIPNVPQFAPIVTDLAGVIGHGEAQADFSIPGKISGKQWNDSADLERVKGMLTAVEGTGITIQSDFEARWELTRQP